MYVYLLRAPYFLFYDTVKKESYYLDNTAVASQGGAGIRAAQVIADHGVKALLTPRCGENAEKVLRNAEVLVYKSILEQHRKTLTHIQANKLIYQAIFMPDFMDTEVINMKIAVLSGKGGTGKTLVSVNLAAVAKNINIY